MVNSHTHKFQRFISSVPFYLFFLVSFLCPQLWAAQEAMVLVDKALIYSDQQTTSPVGYVTRGKKILVGDIARNKGRVYPIVVSGKIAYIKVLDVTTEKESMDSTRLTAERFQNITSDVPQSKFLFSYFTFASKINLSQVNGELKDKDSLTWHGLSLKGEVLAKKRLDMGLVTNFMSTQFEEEMFRVFEFGLTTSYRLIDKKRFLARLEGQALAIPFSTYSLGEDFRVKSFGYSVGGGLNLNFLFNKNWGLETGAGAYYTKLLGFDAPDPFGDFSTSFIGLRANVGLNYTY